MKVFGLPAERLEKFIGHLMSKGEVFAPVNKGPAFAYEHITAPGQAVLDYPSTILPPKKYFQPVREVLFSFDRETQAITEPKESTAKTNILFGLHNYDMHGILCLDYIMTQGNVDQSWVERRKNWFFVGTSYTPDNYHFSPSVGISPKDRTGLDLFLVKAQGGYNVEVLTPNGEKLLAGYDGSAASLPEIKEEIRFQNKILPNYQYLPELFNKIQDHPVWTKNAKNCLSCGSCTLVCPTCYCFDVNDELDLSCKTGERVRSWDSCQVLPFTEVAGGEYFRHKTSARILHRIHRKFKYISDRYGKPFCVGCGRCTRACTAKISITEIVNEIARGSNA